LVVDGYDRVGVANRSKRLFAVSVGNAEGMEKRRGAGSKRER
jgi:hypothetical protein